MPARLNAKGPGEFIRDHLQDPLVGGRDYVGSMYQAYKEHLRTAGYRKLPCRPTFHKYVWLLKETGAIVFDGAEAISFSDAPPVPLPPNYQPACGMPAPRHYYRLTDPQSDAFDSPEAAWRAQRGLPTPIAPPRPRVRVVTRLAPAPPPVEERPPVEVPPFDVPERPGRRAAQDLVRHLRALEALDPEAPEVQAELERLQSDLQPWLELVEEAVSREEEKDEPDEDRLDGLQEMRQALDDAQAALGEGEVAVAVEALELAFPPGAPRIAPPRRRPQGGP